MPAKTYTDDKGVERYEQNDEPAVYGADGRLMHPNTLESARRVGMKPGETRNPKGASKNPLKIFKEELKKILLQPSEDNPDITNIEDLTIEAIKRIKRTKNDTVFYRAYELFRDAIDGKPTQETTITNPDGSIVPVIFLPTQRQFKEIQAENADFEEINEKENRQKPMLRDTGSRETPTKSKKFNENHKNSE